ncbi:threonine/serine exporter family protein [Anaerovorax sp. IOR16]|uniref:threonine/serine exporter family protein n=1 Tax=Anaerovorax sp. IOR16 TaxID=2773458 RepID=UPI0019D186F4|nr:threonine/serine exporter family protein [Anaerovorax sp. IOR16]
MLLQFFYAFASTAGFCLIFNVPRRHMISASTVGALGWTAFQYALFIGHGNVAACFFGSCVVALLSDICSRVFKDATTLFIIPGILPLVPGAGMYNTMLAFLDSNFEKMTKIGSETILMAGSIAVALLMVASLIKAIVTIKRGFFDLFRKRKNLKNINSEQ